MRAVWHVLCHVMVTLCPCTLQVLLDRLLVVTVLTADKASVRKLKLNGWSQHTKKENEKLDLEF